MEKWRCLMWGDGHLTDLVSSTDSGSFWCPEIRRQGDRRAELSLLGELLSAVGAEAESESNSLRANLEEQRESK
jgi:hypothetical protein